MKIIRITSLKALPFILLAVIFCWSCDNKITQEDDGDEYIIVSNVFTPDGDEKNDYFEVTTKDKAKEVSLKIYTRAGVLVFSIEALRCVWDGCTLSGQPMVAGIYHYTAEVVGTEIKKNGFVYLYR